MISLLLVITQETFLKHHFCFSRFLLIIFTRVDSSFANLLEVQKGLNSYRSGLGHQYGRRGVM